MSRFLSTGNNSLFHRGCSSNLKSILEERSSQVDKKAEKGDGLCSSLHWIPGKRRLKNNSKVTCHYKTEWKRAQDAVYWIHLAKAQEKGKNILSKQNRMPSLLTRECRLIVSRGWCLRKVRRLSINHSPHQGQLQEEFSEMLEINSSRVIWEASGNWSGRGAKVITTVLRRLLDTAAKTML